VFQVSSNAVSLVAEISTGNNADSRISLPPWLASSFADSLDDIDKEQRLQDEWEFLQMELEDQGWSEAEIESALEAISVACSGKTEWMLGCLEFLQTLLDFPELATPTVVLASTLHYSECVMARESGVYDTVRQRLLPGMTMASSSRPTLALPPYPTVLGMDLVQDSNVNTPQVVVGTTIIDRRKQKRVERRKYRRKLKQQLVVDEHQLLISSSSSDGVESSSPFSEEVLELAGAASQIKRAEIVSEVVLARKGKQDHDKIQNLLVSVGGEDWRALAIRCIASLYRLQASDPVQRIPESIATARSAMHVYAPLAQRMGLHVLKTRLENKAFYHLYPRQYKASVALFEHQGDSMKAVEQYLQQQIWHLLQQDPNLKQVDWQVTARVKEPYSLWKKLLRKSVPGTMHWTRRPDGEITTRSNTSSVVSSKNDGSDVMQSMLRIRDGVALRVIVQSWPIPGESDSDRQARDHLSCYYIHHLIRSVFPESHPDHVKDYIANPKPNGYQSLHHTSSLRMNQLEIPFEIQVRSQDMHRIAEFGVAAHWDYKRGSPAPSTPHVARIAAPAGRRRSSTALPHPDEPPAESTSRGLGPPSSTSGTDTPYLQALEVARKSLVQSSVFVFVAGTTTSSSMEHGQLMSVRRGERVADIWNHVMTERPNDMPTIWRNGRLAELNETVQNGDVLLFQQEEQYQSSKRTKLLKSTSKR
jgi:ppGpp synthetase/RelA/SpoT-type nucleotidyltranferase